MPRRKQPVYRDGKVHVQQSMCKTCIFRPGNLMRLQPGRVKSMVRGALKNDSCIPCHDTLEGAQAICRGFWDRHNRDVFPLRLAQAFGNVEFVSKRMP